ncbi:unnamed protein product [Merluccius merluccius]
MSSSEVQTDVSDPLGKLVDRLDRLSTKEEREGDEEKKYVPKAARVTRCFPDIGALKETSQRRSITTHNTVAPPVDNVTRVHKLPWPLTNDSQDVNQAESPLSERGQASCTLKAGPHPVDSQAAISGVAEFLPLASSSVNEEDEEAQETLCLMAIEMSAVVRSSMRDSGGETHVPLMATQSEGSEADQDVCACCGTSLEENNYSTDHLGEHFHGSQLEVPHVGMAHNFVEEFAAEEAFLGKLLQEYALEG